MVGGIQVKGMEQNVLEKLVEGHLGGIGTCAKWQA